MNATGTGKISSAAILHFGCTLAWCTNTDRQMHLMQILTTTFREFQLTFFASVDTYQFENMTRSQSYQSYCFCLSWGSRWRWLLPLDSLTTTWRAWRSRRRDDKKDPTVNNILDNYSFQHWNLCLATHRWPWETICWHVFLQEVQIMRSELRIKDCDNCLQLSSRYIPNKCNIVLVSFSCRAHRSNYGKM